MGRKYILSTSQKLLIRGANRKLFAKIQTQQINNRKAIKGTTTLGFSSIYSIGYRYCLEIDQKCF